MRNSDLHTFVADPSREFSLRFVSSRGEVIDVACCVCTSFYSKGKTINIKLLPSGQVRTINRWTILKINNENFYL